MAQSHEIPGDVDVQSLMYAVRNSVKHDDLRGKQDELKVSLPVRIQRVVDLACEKKASSWLIATPQLLAREELNRRANTAPARCLLDVH